MSKISRECAGVFTICLAVFLALVTAASAAPPATVTIQAKLEMPGGAPLTGSRAYTIQLFDAETGGAQLGTDISGNAAFSATGRTAITIPWPVAAESANEVWYRLGVDSDAVPDGVQADEFFPDRIEVTSVPFARRAADSDAVGGTAAADLSTDAERDGAIATEVSDRDAAIAAAVAAAVAGLVPSPALPAAPTELRILPSLRGAPYRKLIWNISGFGGMANFIVYESGSSITDGNKASAIQRFVSTTHLELPIFGNSGMRFFRVAALNFAGDEGSLSNEFGLDTTSRIAYIADQEVDEIFELYVAPATGEEAPVKVNSPLFTVSDVTAFAFSPDGRRIAYLADQSADDVFELYVAPSTGGGSSVKVNSPLVAGGDVNGFVFSPDGANIVYLADQVTDGILELYTARATGGGASIKINGSLVTGGLVFPGTFTFSPDGTRVAYIAAQDDIFFNELYVAPAGGGGTSVKINGPIIGGGNVISFSFSPDGSLIAYRADQDTDGVIELYIAPATGSVAPVKINSPPVTGGDVFLDFDFIPDGTRIALRGDLDFNTQSELFVAPVSGGGPITKIHPQLASTADVFSWGFSPDGVSIAYVADLDVDNVANLYLSPATGVGAAVKLNPPLVTGGDLILLAYSPDGSRIVYSADQNTDQVVELYVVPTIGGGASVKISSPMVTGGDVLGTFAFSPDAARIAYQADQDTNGVFELYVTPAIGGGASAKINAPLVAGGDVTAFALSPLGFTQ